MLTVETPKKKYASLHGTFGRREPSHLHPAHGMAAYVGVRDCVLGRVNRYIRVEMGGLPWYTFDHL